MKEHGVNIQYGNSDYSVDASKTFDEEVEMMVNEKRRDLFKSCGKPNTYNISGVFRQIYQAVRKTKASRIMFKIQDITELDIRDIIETVAKELSCAYEYQLGMLKDANDVEKIADYCVLCMFTYLKTNESVFHPCSLLKAVLEVSPKHKNIGDQVIKTRIVKVDSLKRKHSQQWRIQGIIKEPGLRTCSITRHSGVDPEQETGSKEIHFYGCFTPYGCSCRPDKYGFRSALHVWDESSKRYAMIENDAISCHGNKTEIDFKDNNVHQSYQPRSSCNHVTEFELDLRDSVKVANKPNKNSPCATVIMNSAFSETISHESEITTLPSTTSQNGVTLNKEALI